MDYARNVKKNKIDFFKEALLWHASFFIQKEDRSHGPMGMGIGVYMYSVPIATFYTFILAIYFTHQECKNRYRIEEKMVENRIPVPLLVNKVAIEHPYPQNHEECLNIEVNESKYQAA